MHDVPIPVRPELRVPDYARGAHRVTLGRVVVDVARGELIEGSGAVGPIHPEVEVGSLGPERLGPRILRRFGERIDERAHLSEAHGRFIPEVCEAELLVDDDGRDVGRQRARRREDRELRGAVPCLVAPLVPDVDAPCGPGLLGEALEARSVVRHRRHGEVPALRERPLERDAPEDAARMLAVLDGDDAVLEDTASEDALEVLPRHRVAVIGALE
jgi:hypothetical protein